MTERALWRAPLRPALEFASMLMPRRFDAETADGISSIQAWTRQRFKLDPASAVLVSEVACRMPGCPPLETVVAFWTADDSRHQFRLLKPLAEVRYDDIGWLFGTPSAHDPATWSCC